jgi:hypothetical protein
MGHIESNPGSTTDLGRLSLREHDAGYLVERLARVFARRPVISAWGLQYRLCETGPAKLDPRLLSAALSKLAGSRREPKRPEGGLFADPTMEDSNTDSVTRECVLAASALKAAIEPIRPDTLADAFGMRLETDDVLDIGSVRQRRLVAKTSIAAYSILATLPRTIRLHAWILNDLNWLYPDDPRLWRLLTGDVLRDQQLLIVARKIAPVTFHLLKAVGARGVQFYSLLSSSEPKAEARTAADTLGLPHLLSLTDAHGHAVRKQIRNSVKAFRNAPILSLETRQMLASAEQSGFGQNGRPTARELMKWTATNEHTWPDVWSKTLYAWATRGRVPLNESERARGGNESTHREGEVSDISSDPMSDAAWDQPLDVVGGELTGEPTTVTRVGHVAAEVDRDTWDRLLQRMPPSAAKIRR